MAVPIFVRTPQPKVHPRPTTGRLETVSGNSSGTFTYGYETNSGLIKTVTRPGLLETQPALRVTNTWDPARDVLLTKANELVSGETVTDVSSITYTVNPIGQRTHATRTGAATNGTEWGYDTLGQLETADDTNPAADRAYQYDSIGNRLFSEISNTQISNPPQATTTAYAPNLLNQYGNITTGNTSFTPSHDDDGNQKNAQIQALGSSGLASCVYHWDAENRLTSVTTPGGAVLTSYAYDAFSRLISRSVGVSPTTTTAYIHDGWNRVAEYTVTLGDPNATPPTEPVASLSKTYLWGMDLSGGFQGAGGVGGLLSVNRIGSPMAYPVFDGNGNITGYLGADGTLLAHFEYDPFGNTVVNTDATNQFEYRFSTKPQDPATGLLYYGYRWYDPVTGRWPSRDPITEKGGLNLYGFVLNNGYFYFDDLGLTPNPVDGGFAFTGHVVSGRNQDAFFRQVAGDAQRLLEKDGKPNPGANKKVGEGRTGKDLLEHLRILSKENCCIKNLRIGSHGGPSGLGSANESADGFYDENMRHAKVPIDAMTDAHWENVANEWQCTVEHAKRVVMLNKDRNPEVLVRKHPNSIPEGAEIGEGGATIGDLEKEIAAKNIVFCKPCYIYVHGCGISHEFAERLARTNVSGCTVFYGQGECSDLNGDTDRWKHGDGAYRVDPGGKHLRVGSVTTAPDLQSNKGALHECKHIGSRNCVCGRVAMCFVSRSFWREPPETG